MGSLFILSNDKSLELVMNEEDNADYMNGYKARGKGLLKNCCPFGERRMRRRSFWLGGFSDRDIELKNKAGAKNNV